MQTLCLRASGLFYLCWELFVPTALRPGEERDCHPEERALGIEIIFFKVFFFSSFTNLLPFSTVSCQKGKWPCFPYKCIFSISYCCCLGKGILFLSVVKYFKFSLMHYSWLALWTNWFHSLDFRPFTDFVFITFPLHYFRVLFALLTPYLLYTQVVVHCFTLDCIP